MLLAVFPDAAVILALATQPTSSAGPATALSFGILLCWPLLLLLPPLLFTICYAGPVGAADEVLAATTGNQCLDFMPLCAAEFGEFVCGVGCERRVNVIVLSGVLQAGVRACRHEWCAWLSRGSCQGTHD